MNDAKETWQRVDAFVQRFEEALQNGGRPAIEDFLPKDGPIRLAVLKELVQVDRERRLQAGEAVRDEEYLERFPELANGPPSITGRATIDLAPRRPGKCIPARSYCIPELTTWCRLPTARNWRGKVV